MSVKVGDKVTVIGEYVGKVVNINDYREPCFKYAIDLEGYDEDVVFVGEEQIKILDIKEMSLYQID